MSRKIYPFVVAPQAVDFNLKITLASMTDLLMTTAGINADENGFGVRQLNQIGATWVLLRFATEFRTYPSQYETITIETWIEEISRVTSTRNFIVRNQENEILGYAISVWSMIDVESRRPKDLLSLQDMFHFATGDSIAMKKPVKVNPVNDAETVYEIQARYSHIDFNQHVNTMKYIEWIGNVFDIELYREHQIERFDINFNNEILFGEYLEVKLKETDNLNFYVELNSEDKSNCRAQIQFTSQIIAK